MLLINNNNEEKTMEKEEGIISNIKDESKNNDKGVFISNFTSWEKRLDLRKESGPL